MGTFIQHGQRKVTYPKASVRPQGRPPQPFKSSRAAAPQEEEIGAGPKLLLHGRQVPRMLQHHHRLLPRPDRRPVRILLDRPLPANRREGSIDRGLLLPPQGISERSPALSMSMDRTDSALGFIHLLVRRKGPRSRITIDDDGMEQGQEKKAGERAKQSKAMVGRFTFPPSPSSLATSCRLAGEDDRRHA